MGVWIEAARPRTLVAAVAPVLVGTAAAAAFVPWRFVAALIVALALQVAVNYANDYFDGVRGIDQPARVGPRRVTAAGLVTPAQIRMAIALAILVAVIAGLSLVIVVGPELLLIGLASILAALGYSGGPKPYASLGLGEVFVFLFFGLIPAFGSAYIQQPGLNLLAIAASVPVGLLAVGIILVNNIRDIDTDSLAGKRTLAVRLGHAGSRRVFSGIVVAAFGTLVLPVVVAGSLWPLLALLAIPLAVTPVRTTASSREPRRLIQALGAIARLQLVFALLLTAGLLAPRLLG